MLKLDATTKTIEVVLGGAITTNQLPVTAHYIDFSDSAGTTTPIEADTATNNTTAVTIVAAPASGVVRDVNYLSIYNKDTVSATVTIRYNDNTTIRELYQTTLAAGQSLQYIANSGFFSDAASVNVAASQSGTWTIQQGGTWTVTANIGTSGSLALDATLTGGTQKSKLVDAGGSNVASVSAGGALKVDNSGVTQPVSGTVTVQQGTASSLKVDLSGTGANATALKVDGSATTQPVSGTVTVQQGTASSLKVDLSGTAANSTAIKVDGSAVTQPVSGTLSVVATPPSDRTNLSQSLAMSSTSNSVALAVPGCSTASIQVTGSWTGAIALEGTTDGTNWFSVNGVYPRSGVFLNSITANDTWLVGCGGLAQIRARCSTTGTGTATVSIEASLGCQLVTLGNAVQILDHGSLTQSVAMSSTANVASLTSITGTSTANIQVTGTWTGTLIFEAQTDGTNWFTINAVVPTTGAIVTTTTANGQWLVPCAGYGQIRVRCSVTGTGTATVSINASTGCQTVSLSNSLPTGANVIGALVSNQSVNVAQVAGGTSTNAGQTGALQVGGAVATNNNVSSTTNPILIAGSDYGGTPKIQSLKVDSSGNQQFNLTQWNGTAPTAAAALADAASLATAPQIGCANLQYNGSTLDLQRGNVYATGLASASRSASTNTATIPTYNCRGVRIYLVCSVMGASSTLTINPLAVEPVTSGGYLLLAAPAAINSATTMIIELYPGDSGTAGGNITSRYTIPLPARFLIQVTHSNANACTYSLGYELLV